MRGAVIVDFQSSFAAVSVMSNIAEGFERGEKNEFVQFLYIAKGSSGEIRAQLQVAHDQKYIDDRDYARVLDCVRRVSGMLSNFISHLQQSGYRGEKHTRAQRRAKNAQKERIAGLRAAQEANMAAAKNRESMKASD